MRRMTPSDVEFTVWRNSGNTVLPHGLTNMVDPPRAQPPEFGAPGALGNGRSEVEHGRRV